MLELMIPYDQKNITTLKRSKKWTLEHCFSLHAFHIEIIPPLPQFWWPFTVYHLCKIIIKYLIILWSACKLLKARYIWESWYYLPVINLCICFDLR
jgi:hypothetical protein